MKLKYFYVFLFICFSFTSFSRANEKSQFNLAINNYQDGDYFHALTELKRYQTLYPQGKDIANSYLFMGRAYFRGGNYSLAFANFSKCYKNYTDTISGEKALLDLSYIRLLQGSPLYAYKTTEQFAYLYPQSKLTERAYLYQCYSLALMSDLEKAKNRTDSFLKLYPQSEYSQNVKLLQKDIITELNRHKKSKTLSVIGSIFIPGFSWFYVGNVKVGLLTLLSNAAFIYLLTDAILDRDIYRIVAFSLIELTFYQWSLTAALENVDNYNARDNYEKRIKIKMIHHF